MNNQLYEILRIVVGEEKAKITKAYESHPLYEVILELVKTVDGLMDGDPIDHLLTLVCRGVKK